MSVAAALILINEKAGFQCARTPDVEAGRSLLEIKAHCSSALRIIAELRRREIEDLPCSADCVDGKHTKTCPYWRAKNNEDNGS